MPSTYRLPLRFILAFHLLTISSVNAATRGTHRNATFPGPLPDDQWRNKTVVNYHTLYDKATPNFYCTELLRFGLLGYIIWLGSVLHILLSLHGTVKFHLADASHFHRRRIFHAYSLLPALYTAVKGFYVLSDCKTESGARLSGGMNILSGLTMFFGMSWSLYRIQRGRSKRRSRESDRNVQREEQRVAFGLGLVSFGAALVFPALFWHTQVLTTDKTNSSLITGSTVPGAGTESSLKLSFTNTFDHSQVLPAPFFLAIFFAIITISVKISALYPHRHFSSSTRRRSMDADTALTWRVCLGLVGASLIIGLGGFYAHFFVSMGKILGDPWGKRVYHSGPRGYGPMVVDMVVLLGPALVHLGMLGFMFVEMLGRIWIVWNFLIELDEMVIVEVVESVRFFNY